MRERAGGMEQHDNLSVYSIVMGWSIAEKGFGDIFWIIFSLFLIEWKLLHLFTNENSFELKASQVMGQKYAAESYLFNKNYL